MKKILTILFTLMILLICIPSAHAIRGTYINGKIIINWIDFGDIDSKRPSSITLKLEDYGEPDPSVGAVNRVTEQLVVLNEVDATVETDPNDSNITRWIFDNYQNAMGIDYLFKQDTTTSIPAFRYMGVSANGTTGIDGYTYLKDEGAIVPDDRFDMYGGTQDTLSVTYVLETYTSMKLKVNYNDDNGRDNVRNLKLAIKGTNLGVTAKDDLVRLNAYQEFNIAPNKTINTKVDTYEEKFYTSKYYNSNLITYVLEDVSGVINNPYTLDLDIAGDEAIATLNYTAQKINLPIEVKWLDNSNKENTRPDEITLKAYDQNGNLEKDITVSKDDNWSVTEEVFKNMIYSGGTPIDYVLKIASDENYEYQVTGDNTGFTIEAKLAKAPVEENPYEDTTIDDPKEEIKNEIKAEVPQTYDNIIIYALSLTLSSGICLGTFMLLSKKFK